MVGLGVGERVVEYLVEGAMVVGYGVVSVVERVGFAVVGVGVGGSVVLTVTLQVDGGGEIVGNGLAN